MYLKFEPITIPHRDLESKEIDQIFFNIENYLVLNKQDELLNAIKTRIREFDIAIKKAEQNALKQYENFAIAIQKCFTQPNHIDIYSQHYFNNYHPIGNVIFKEKTAFLENKPLLAGVIFSGALLTTGVLCCIFGPMTLGIAALAFGAIALTICLISHFSSPEPNAGLIIQSEETLFNNISSFFAGIEPVQTAKWVSYPDSPLSLSR